MQYLLEQEVSPNSLDDKIFIIDSECFLIESGGNPSKKQFIRIGNSKKLPKDLIPMIDTVILPGRLMGSPFNEKFNITDSQVKYIGTLNNISAFLKFQKTLKLNIPKENTVKIEFDIPIIPDRKLPQEKSEILGIFTKDGNFKLIDGTQTLFDLFAFSIYSSSSTFDIAAKTIAHRSDSISIFLKNESIFMSIDDSTVLINGSDLTLKDLIVSPFNPDSIKYIYNPKKITPTLLEFLKWKSYRQTTFIASKIEETVNLLGNILNNIISEKLNSQNFSNAKKISINSIRNTSSFIVKTNSNQKIAFINDVNATKILSLFTNSLKPDIIFINYDIYKDNVLLFKSTKIPIVIINDTLLNISSILPADSIQIEKNIEYELKFVNSENELKEFCEDFDDIHQSILSKHFHDLKKYLSSIRMDSYAIVKLQNLTSLLRYFLNNTVDREEYSHLKQIIQSLTLMNLNAKNPAIEIKQYLIIKNHSVYLFYKLNHSEDKILQSQLIAQMKLRNSVLEDRISGDNKRLVAFIKNHNFQEISYPLNTQANLNSGKKTKFSLKPLMQSKFIELVTGHLKKIPVKFQILAGVTIILTILFINKEVAINEEDTSQILTQTQIDEYNLVPSIYKSEISEREIFIYANELAKINGFREINNLSRGGKSPHWLLPDTELTLTDGQKIMVKRGDSLWRIAREKLIEIDLKFYKIIHEIETKNTVNKKELLQKASQLQFSENHKNILQKYLNE